MPLGGSKFLSKNRRLGTGGSATPLQISVAETISGNTNTSVTFDATTVTYNITSSLINTSIGYNITGTNIATSDFSDSTLSANITTDSNGNATITKTITSTTGSGHKDFTLTLVRPENPSSNLATTSTYNLYEVIPANISGGDTTTTTNYTATVHTGDDAVIDANATANTYVIGSRIHEFTTAGNANLTITDFGNYTGNANIWNKVYLTNADATGNSFVSTEHYWEQGLGIKSLVVGAGGETKLSSGGGGSGELGVLFYNFANITVDTGTYTMTVGNASANGTSIAFAGNVDMSKAAEGGGDGALGSGNRNGFDGGSGGGNQTTGIGGFAKINKSPFSTDLANNSSNVAFPGNFKTHVVWASGNDATSENDGGVGGAGAGVMSGTAGASNASVNGYGLTNATSSNSGQGGKGMTWSMDRNRKSTYVQNTTDTFYSDFRFNFSNCPLFTGTVADRSFAKGGHRYGKTISGLVLNPGDGCFNGGSGFADDGPGQNGIVTIAYPYKAAYRFITTEDLS